MSKESEQERSLTFQQIRENSMEKMSNTLDDCKRLIRFMGLGDISLSNIIIRYNNRIIALEKEFTRAGIDFYDRLDCESRFIIEQRLQAYILEAKIYLDTIHSTLNISKEQIQEFVDSRKNKPNFFQRVFLHQKYQPKKSVLTPEQMETVKSAIHKLEECSDKVYNFSIKNDFEEAILFSFILSVANGATIEDLKKRLTKIDSEIQKLGYDSIADNIATYLNDQFFLDLQYSI